MYYVTVHKTGKNEICELKLYRSTKKFDDRHKFKFV